MTQPLFPSAIGTNSQSAKFLTTKTMVRNNQKTAVRRGPGAETRQCLRKRRGEGVALRLKRRRCGQLSGTA